MKQHTKTYDELLEENKDLKYLLDSINKYVIPGEFDSSEAATDIIKKQREKILALEKKLEIAVKALKDIESEEINSQRPGGGYSKSAIISYKAIKEIEGEK